ncbi:MAG: archaellin/type IV pilin N-terminal domain-containing protein [Thermofilaceae archaeon]
MKRKGVSPVIATLLLIVIAVAAAVLAYIWITGYMGTLTPRETPTQMQERLKIDAVQTGTDINIFVVNIGEIDTSIISAYILDENFAAVCGGPLTTAINIAKEEAKSVTVPGTCTLTSGTTYIAKVSAKGGAEATYTFTKG